MAGQLRMGHSFVDSQEDDLAVHVLRQAVQVSKTLAADSEPGLISLTGACALLLGVLEARETTPMTPDAISKPPQPWPAVSIPTATTTARSLGRPMSPCIRWR